MDEGRKWEDFRQMLLGGVYGNLVSGVELGYAWNEGGRLAQ